jgi:hypothetical protein
MFAAPKNIWNFYELEMTFLKAALFIPYHKNDKFLMALFFLYLL